MIQMDDSSISDGYSEGFGELFHFGEFYDECSTFVRQLVEYHLVSFFFLHKS